MRRITLLIAGIALAVALYAGYWFYVAHRLHDAIGAWAGARRAEGYELSWRGETLDGFPFAFRLQFEDATLRASRPIPYALSSAALILTAAPWAPDHWRWTAPQGVTLADASGAASLLAAIANGTLAPGADAVVIGLNATGVSGRGLAQGFAVQSATLQLTLPNRPPANHLDPALSAAADLAAVTVPIAVPSLGPQIDHLSLAATVKGRLPAQGPADQALAAWRDDDGTVEVTAAHLIWGDVDVALSGTVALDETLQPIGALSATIKQPAKAVDAAVASGSLAPRFAALAKTILSALAKPAADGQPAVTVPVTLQNDRLFLGPAPIAILPRIAWH